MSFSYCVFTRNLLSILLFKKNPLACYGELPERINEESDSLSCCWKVLLLLLNAERYSCNIV